MKLNLITNYRIDHGLSQKDLAKRLKISQQRLSYYENGMNPPADFIHAFRKLTGIDLLDGTKVQPNNELEFLKRENETLLQLIEQQKKTIALYEQMLKK